MLAVAEGIYDSDRARPELTSTTAPRYFAPGRVFGVGVVSLSMLCIWCNVGSAQAIR